MANLNMNKAILGGHITADPELKTTQGGTNVCTFTIAVNRRGSKEGQPMVDFISCVAWKERAELISRYFKKGSSICIAGEIQTRSWKDGQGNNRYATEVIVSEVYFVDSKSDATPTFSKPEVPQFEEMGRDDDLPF